MSKKVTMEDIAAKLGISKNTVSMVIRDMPGISEQTRKSVLDTANQLGYNYKITAKEPEPKMICLIQSRSHRDSSAFYRNILFGVEDEAKKHMTNTLLVYFDQKDDVFETPLCIKNGMASGIITLGRISDEKIKTIEQFGLPFVMIDHYFDNIKSDCILIDNHYGGYIATEHLIKNGHKNIAFSGDISASINFYDRYQGYLKALKNYNLQQPESASLTFRCMEELVREDINVGIKVLKDLSELPSAIFCCNDVEAFSICSVLNAMGLSVPEDVSVIGFDDTEFSRNHTPAISTIRAEKEIMGRVAVEKLLAKMENETGIIEKLLISPTLVMRDSVKKIKS